MGVCVSTKIDPTLVLIDKRLTKPIASNEKEECKKQGKWCELPYLPLEKIYFFQRREDQVNMSFVCRSWSEGYGSPSVWNVEIESTWVYNWLMKNWCRHLVEFLQILTSKTQLSSVKFLYFANFLWRIDKPTYNNICREVVDLLASQRHLKIVEFDLCFFNFQECVEILRKLTENSRESPTHLKLQNFLRR
ncbi:hypothetical protein AVEN_120953-1 [Araneus ventricosus]|uniref:F-box domain-containing protein n=1 Tax=Araneus ventricosus TaxID=182803 RepID=A0A4Y2EGH8_ARAVE|nr:hypothetical protein AVEN_120953-1 [Araneus ventricosus]